MKPASDQDREEENSTRTDFKTNETMPKVQEEQQTESRTSMPSLEPQIGRTYHFEALRLRFATFNNLLGHRIRHCRRIEC